MSLEASAAPAKAGKQRDASLLDVCEQLVAFAKKAGASDSEAYAERTRESSVKVREGNVEVGVPTVVEPARPPAPK